jgi:predicted methyltransferase
MTGTSTSAAAGRLGALLALSMFPSPAVAQPPGPDHPLPPEAHGQPHRAGSVHATMQHRFTDVAAATRRLEDPARAAWQRPAQLIAALGIAPGAHVADLGAGTGYLLPWLVEAVGPTGSILALEVEGALVAHLRERAEAASWPQVVPILSSFEAPRLPPASVDLGLLVNVYHHLDGRDRWLQAVRVALRPGGRLAVIDFKPGPLPVGPPEGHRVAPDEVEREALAAGLELVGRLDLLPHQYVIVLRRPR